MFDLVIGGKAFVNGELQDCEIGITDGTIERISRSGFPKGVIGERHMSYRGIILPGAVDTHVHFREPGLTQKEDFGTGTASAAFGGVTTVLDMPNTRPPTIDRFSLEEKATNASIKAHIDHGFNLALIDPPGCHGVFEWLKGKGGMSRPAAFKAFLGESTGSLVLSPISSLSALKADLIRSGMRLMVHAEDGTMFKEIEQRSMTTLLGAHHLSRPPKAESSAIIRTKEALGDAMDGVHVLHISSEEGLRVGQSSGATMEVSPHHLLLDIKNCPKKGMCPALFKVNPPLRTTQDRSALLKALEDGTILTIGSDHAPHTLKEKEEMSPPPSGVPGVETMMPMMLSLVKDRKLSLKRLVEAACRAPAMRFDTGPKGQIAEGAHADLAVYDANAPRKIRGEDLHSKCGWTPYEGMKGIFPSKVYSRGELVVEDGCLCTRPGRGRNIVEFRA